MRQYMAKRRAQVKNDPDKEIHEETHEKTHKDTHEDTRVRDAREYMEAYFRMNTRLTKIV